MAKLCRRNKNDLTLRLFFLVVIYKPDIIFSLLFKDQLAFHEERLRITVNVNPNVMGTEGKCEAVKLFQHQCHRKARCCQPTERKSLYSTNSESARDRRK